MSLDHSVRTSGAHFAADGSGAGEALDGFLDSLRVRPRLLGLGEPTHGVEAFPLLRNEMLRHLVEHRGYRSVAVESDCLGALTVNAYVTTGRGDLDEVLATGFSHGFGEFDSTRLLVTWLREHNEGLASEDQVRCYGFDAPTEIDAAPGPRSALAALHRYLVERLEPDRIPHEWDAIEELLGAESAWTNPAAAMDPGESVGRSGPARELRVLTDDLLAVLEADTPGLRASGADEHDRACLHARTAQGLLRYHAVMAVGGADRLSRMLAIRDGMMAANLLAIADQESRRGPTLVFAHNQHLRRDRSEWRLPELDLRWWSAGAGAAARLGERYAVIACDFDTDSGERLPDPDSGSLQGVLREAVPDRALLPADRLAALVGDLPGTSAPPEAGYFPLSGAGLGGIDALAFLTRSGE